MYKLRGKVDFRLLTDNVCDHCHKVAVCLREQLVIRLLKAEIFYSICFLYVLIFNDLLHISLLIDFYSIICLTDFPSIG